MSTQTGVIKFFAEKGGYGFILPDGGGKDVFFHRTNCADKNLPPQKDDKVSFHVIVGKKGNEAASVTVVG